MGGERDRGMMEGGGGVDGGWVLIGVKGAAGRGNRAGGGIENGQEDDLCVCHCQSPSHFNLRVIRCHDDCVVASSLCRHRNREETLLLMQVDSCL